MSSNIKIIRICEYCHHEFIAKTTVTKYCSIQCNRRAYKAKVKASKIQKSNAETNKLIDQAYKKRIHAIEYIKTKEFLTVKDITELLGCSRQSVYKIIRSGKLNSINRDLINKVVVKRSDLDKLFCYD